MNLRRRDWLMRLVGMSAGEALRSRAVHDVGGSLVLRIVGKILQIGLAIILTRLLPLKVFGMYALVMSWVMVLSIPSLVGTPQFVQREIAVAKSREQWGRVRALLRWSTSTVSIASFLVFIVASTVVFVVKRPHSPDFWAFLVGFIVIPMSTVLTLWQAQLRGWGAILAGQIPDTILKPVLFVVLLLVVSIFWVSGLNAMVVLALQGIAVAAVLLITAFLKLRYLPVPVCTSVPRPESRKWLRLSSRFTLLGGLAVLNNQVGILMIGAMAGKADAGLFSVAVKGADLLTITLMAANMALSPRMAAFFHDGSHVKLQTMITRAYRVVVVITTPLILLLIFAGGAVLHIFGPAYVVAWPALIILSVGQSVNVFSGPVGAMLNMAGHERITIVGVVASLTVTVVSNVILIPLMGVNGAALSTALGVVTWNGLLVVLCYRRLGIWTPAFGISLLKKSVG